MTDKDALGSLRHSLAHILANAIQRLRPDVKFGVGPVVEDGFYYDIDLGDKTFSEVDLAKIEAEMARIIKEDQPFKKSELAIDEAIKWSKDEKQPYKEELLNDLKRSGTTLASEIDVKELGIEATSDKKVETVSFYRNGDFVDLCRGPHLKSTGQAGAFKLIRISGAYWRGKELNPQMQRIYGVGFETKKDLESYLKRQELAKERDHRKIGQELDLFTFSELVGAGLPLYTPRGTVIIEELKNALKDISRQYGSDQVSIPHLAKKELYQISGHAEKFEEELFTVKSHYNQEFVLKPVNCPHHTQIYASRQRSYRDLPLRYIEQTMQYRDEKPGQIGGLQRTRGFTVDDGHIFCMLNQIEGEVNNLIHTIRDFYTNLGLWGNHWVSLSVRDKKTPEKYIGEPVDWDKAEELLSKINQDNNLNAKLKEGEAALYGPKIDFMFKDAIGRETQLATVQLDFAMPKRFGLSYIDDNSNQQVPVMIHRAILGSFERFLMLLIEHFAGRFPVWLSPEQIRLITVNQDDDNLKYANNVLSKAVELGLRISLDDSNETVSKKIRNAETMKVPFTIVIGEKEVRSDKLSPRVRGDLSVQDKQQSSTEFLGDLKALIDKRAV